MRTMTRRSLRRIVWIMAISTAAVACGTANTSSPAAGTDGGTDSGSDAAAGDASAPTDGSRDATTDGGDAAANKDASDGAAADGGDAEASAPAVGGCLHTGNLSCTCVTPNPSASIYPNANCSNMNAGKFCMAAEEQPSNPTICACSQTSQQRDAQKQVFSQSQIPAYANVRDVADCPQ